MRIEVFRDFPYLYDGNFEYERAYLQTYAESPHSVVVVVTDGAAVVGASTGIPLLEEDAAFRAPFPSDAAARIFYCGESVLLKAYRGRGLYRRFFEGRERHARTLGGFDACAFCAVERPRDHALRPADYVPLDAVWSAFGYRKHPELVTAFPWKDVDCELETSKPMTFWLKQLEAP